MESNAYIKCLFYLKKCIDDNTEQNQIEFYNYYRKLNSEEQAAIYREMNELRIVKSKNR